MTSYQKSNSQGLSRDYVQYGLRTDALFQKPINDKILATTVLLGWSATLSIRLTKYWTWMGQTIEGTEATSFMDGRFSVKWMMSKVKSPDFEVKSFSSYAIKETL